MANLSSSEKKTAMRIFWGQLRREDRGQNDSDRFKFLKRIPFFEHLKKKQLEEVAQVIYERDYREDEFIFETGQPGAALFIVHSGEVSIEIPDQKGQVAELAKIGRLSFFGELALLDEAPRSASARATTHTKVFALFRRDLEQLAETHPDITTEIFKSLASIIGSRLKATNELIEKKIKAVA